MAWFKHSCFISYRHGQHAIKQRFITEFDDALSAELELLRNEGVYLDRERLKGGDFYNEELSRGLFESACMILVYQPNYFDVEYTYCAREYRAMCRLEAERLPKLTNAADRNHSLIIPIVLRGPSSIPAEIKNHRLYEDFSKFMLFDEELSKHPSYAPRINQIAQYVHSRCQSLEEAPISVDGAEEFSLPNHDETQAWLRTLRLPRNTFPGTEGS